jgi:hypothetical protein
VLLVTPSLRRGAHVRLCNRCNISMKKLAITFIIGLFVGITAGFNLRRMDVPEHTKIGPSYYHPENKPRKPVGNPHLLQIRVHR